MFLFNLAAIGAALLLAHLAFALCRQQRVPIQVRVFGVGVLAILSTGAVVQGGNNITWTIDTTSKAGRATFYDTRGNSQTQRWTYSLTSGAKLAGPNNANAFMEFCGSATGRIVRVTRLLIVTTVATGAIYGDILVEHRLAPSTSTGTYFTLTAHDSNAPPATSRGRFFSAGATTDGQLLGRFWNEQRFYPLTATAAMLEGSEPFFIRDQLESEDWTLHSQSDCLVISNPSVTTTPTYTAAMTWTEEQP